ncbi:MAG: aminodeoxychorismate synthase component I [Elusimicrobiota bacterium]
MDSYFCYEPACFNKAQPYRYYFYNLREKIKIEKASEIKSFFTNLDNLRKDYFIAGFFSFELAYLLEDCLCERKGSLPFAFFGVFKNKAVYDIASQSWVEGEFKVPEEDEGYFIHAPHIKDSELKYRKNVNSIRKLIEEGEVYQVNYTSRFKFDFYGSPYSLYRFLKKRQGACYNMLFREGNNFIASLSPELFFEKKDNNIIIKPMKGTVGRGESRKKDAELAEFLSGDEKNCSENLMIVDLMRNDLSRISERASVKVEKLFEVEKYPTLYQMTSTINSRLKENTTTEQLIKSLFPSGSVTGAPKIRSLEVIRELEDESRGVYTGAMGFFLPSDYALFNVAIRTVSIKDKKGEMGVGGGIVYDSNPKSEYLEARLKGKFLTGAPSGGFKLVETMLYEEGRYKVRPHIDRMRSSAHFFSYKFSKENLIKQLKNFPFEKRKSKIRITLDKEGKIDIEQIFFKEKNKYSLCISSVKTDPTDVFLYHKSTCRPLYKNQLKKAVEQGYYDILFFNDKNQLSEGARTNVYIKKGGDIYTPPLSCGLLNGTVRNSLIKRGKAVEKIISPRDLIHADAIFISNAVIGFRKALLKSDILNLGIKHLSK